jgi:uncharacterized iron-regulated protein
MAETPRALWVYSLDGVEGAREVDWEQMISTLSPSDYLVVGEHHYDIELQASQAKLIREVLDLKQSGSNFTLGWEFLPWTRAEQIQNHFQSWSASEVSDAAFLKGLFGDETRESSYLPLLRLVRDREGQLLATNLTRDEKRPVVQGGIEALDPRLLPSDFREGSEQYWIRFIRALGGHGDPRSLRNYFAAQVLTDEVMADRLVAHSVRDFRILVAGEFHTAYFDGAVASLRRRARGAKLRSVSFFRNVNPETGMQLEEAERMSQMLSPEFGVRADFVVWLR